MPNRYGPTISVIGNDFHCSSACAATGIACRSARNNRTTFYCGTVIIWCIFAAFQGAGGGFCLSCAYGGFCQGGGVQAQVCQHGIAPGLFRHISLAALDGAEDEGIGLLDGGTLRGV